jgi:hypothetical protein
MQQGLEMSAVIIWFSLDPYAMLSLQVLILQSAVNNM